MQEDKSRQQGFAGQIDDGAAGRSGKFFAIIYRSYYAVADDHRLVFQHFQVFDIREPAMRKSDDRGIVIDVFFYHGRKAGLGYGLQTDEEVDSGKEQFFHLVVGLNFENAMFSQLFSCKYMRSRSVAQIFFIIIWNLWLAPRNFSNHHFSMPRSPIAIERLSSA
jgi:hypothetical protein